MPDLIIIRLLPTKPTDGASFTGYLTDLTITVTDMSVTDPTGTSYVVGRAHYNPLHAHSHIVQHFMPPPNPPDLAAVATAVIVPSTVPHPEYQSSDLRLHIKRGTQTLVDTSLNYNAGTDGPPPPPTHAKPPTLADALLYAGLEPTALYLHIPPPTVGLTAGQAFVNVPTDGSPPSFQDLYTAMTTVLTSDPGPAGMPAGTDAYIRSLTPQQCRHIAYEIVWNRDLNPLPIPTLPDTLETLYTVTGPPPPPQSAPTDQQQFESDLTAYYTTYNAQADTLAQYVFALAAALVCEQKTSAATNPGFVLPVLPGIVAASGKTTETDVILTVTGGFDVARQYFYALTANLPVQISADIRYETAVTADSKQVVDNLHAAVDAGIIPAGLPVTPEQAARRLAALGTVDGTAPVCKLSTGDGLVNAWLAYTNPTYTTLTPRPTYDPAADIAPFWNSVLAPLGSSTALTHLAFATGHLQLVLSAVIQQDAAQFVTDMQSSVGVAALGTTVRSVKDLDPGPFGGTGGISLKQWGQFFAAFPGDIPAFTKIGSSATSPTLALAQEVAAFALRLAQFFDLPLVVTPPITPVATPLPLLDLPDDVLANFVTQYRVFDPPFVFGGAPALNPAWAAAAAAAVLPPLSPRGQAWLIEAASAVNFLYWVADVAGVSDQLRFSIAEALYARGFDSAASMTSLMADDFQDALIGTVAYIYAALIQTKAGGAAPPVTPPGGPSGPINDGSLTNCVPPPWLSPLGPVEYLHDLWILSESATCERPQGNGATPTLGSVVTDRRGPLGDLLATRANLETGLPMVDLVNECLEELVAGGAVTVMYQTAGNVLAGHLLGPPGVHPDEDAVPYRHDPERLFPALPEHSSPGPAVTAAYDKLQRAFTACVLPYSQPIDVCRTYLHALHESRFATMRRFQKDITEFVLDPAVLPVDFAAYRWRYPVRIEIAREYLGITPEEYAEIFTANIGPALLAELYGFAPGTPGWMTTVAVLSEFLARTCLTYCELVELWRSGFVSFQLVALGKGSRGEAFPLCEPCYPDKYTIVFPSPAVDLARLAVFIRLWRKLQHVRGARYTFTQLADIASVLQMYLASGSINADFIRQLVAFQMLRDDFRLPLVDESDTTPGTGAGRTHLLALFDVPPGGPLPRKWAWAVEQLIDGIGRHARDQHHAMHRPSEFIKLLAKNLDPLSRLAGFDPADPAGWWHAHPTHALRFAEVLAKIYASHFTVGEILFLFTAGEALDGDDPFPLPSMEESLDLPLDLPEDAGDHTLAGLRRRLLEVEVSEEDVRAWTWPRIERALRDELGFEAPAVLALGRHFFPDVLAHTGTTVTAADRRYRRALPAAATSPAMWNAPADGPFRYDAGAEELWTEIPLKDEAVLEKLSRVRQLSGQEQLVVGDLYYLPRVNLAPFAFLFPTFDEADRRLIQEAGEEERWAYFQRSFARCHARCKVIARHLDAHVAAAVGEHPDERAHEQEAVAWRLLERLLADENRPKPPAPWESNAGTPPLAVTWPRPTGGAFAAILGLLGTGLLGEIRRETSPNVVWREIRGPMDAFGRVKNRWNAPVPTVLPSLNAALPPGQTGFADVRNGIMVSNAGVHPLGGVEGYCVRWHGVLLVEEAGPHEFFAGAGARERVIPDARDVQLFSGAPVREGELPDAERAHGLRWRVTIRHGQKEWVVLTREWPDEGDRGARSSSLPLKRGAYAIDIELLRSAPAFRDADDVHALHTGFELTYVGPDTEGRAVPLPLHRLFLAEKDGPLGVAPRDNASVAATTFLEMLYVSSLRDIRRTYQRAFKALLFARRFELHAKPFADYGQSEIGYLLDHPQRFEGISFYASAGTWVTHRAYFYLDFLPVRDPYRPPADDDRAHPSIQRRQALFDWWERVFDYTWLRRQTKSRSEQPAWLLFDDAAENPTEDPRQVLRHLGINASYAPLVLAYDSGFSVATTDLADERWPVRVWRAEQWVRRIVDGFSFEDVRDARPDLWAASDPGASGGNDNLTKLVQDAFIEQGPPRRYDDLKRLNDELRERARRALIAYLCGPLGGGIAKSPEELRAHLLIDVEVGLRERASRIEEGVTAMQTFERRARLGLEPTWHPSPGFALLWDRSFATFHVWQACKRKETYRENWIEWGELEKARRTEVFRFLESELRRVSLTVPVPGGFTYWNGARPPAHEGLQVLEAREPSTIKILPPKTPPAQDEALNLLGTPERSARRSWLASIPGVAAPPRQLPPGIAGVAPGAPPGAQGKLPFWIEAAIRLGVHFLRVAATGVPPASDDFAPRHEGGAPDDCSPTPAAAGCCAVCGRRHEAVIDEYYFWLVDSRYFSTDPLNATGDDFPQRDPNANWDDDPGADDPLLGNQDLPKLLSWTPRPSVFLMWSRMHDGELMQPRRSTHSLPVDPALKPWDLELMGRKADSLYLRVLGAALPPAGYASTPDPGFRYDLATDSAIAVPQVAPDPPLITSIGGLHSYPFFAYFGPGAPLAPLSMFSESVAVACTLRSHCRFEAALRWYEAFYDPLEHDVRWCWEAVPPPPPPPPPPLPPHRDDEEDHHGHGHARRRRHRPPPPPAPPPPPEVTDGDDSVRAVTVTGGCCRYSCVTDDVARRRDVTLDYLETLLDWGDAIMRRDAPEAFQQARVVFDTAAKILGKRPRTILDEEDLPTPPPTVANLNAALFGVPLNPRLLGLYDRTADRLHEVHASLDARRLRNGRLREAMPYWGDDHGRRYTEDHDCCGASCPCHDQTCAGEDDWCCLHSPYRFSFLVQKAIDLAGEVRTFGASLLGAFEKGDAEYLAYVRASHERQLVELSLAVRKDAWRAADWEVQALQKARELAQNQLAYYTGLIAGGLNSGELAYQSLTNGAIGTTTGAVALETAALIAEVIPDVFVGTVDFVQLPVGSKLAGYFKDGAQIAHTTAAILSMTAGLDLTESGWDRRLAEWHHQVDVFTITIEQIDRQILAAERRRDSALHDLNNTQVQIEQSREVLDILRDKFTNHQLYLYLQKETAALHRQMYELALRAARHAQRAFNFERGYTARELIPGELWQDLREGLLAGERLSLSLRRMEKAYCDENVREYELTKHLSLRQLFASQFLRLKTTGCCEIEIPEWLFDLDYPGQYMRRVRNVALTIPCVVGPYTGVHCRLTLLSSTTRVVPWLLEPIVPCCKALPPPKPRPAPSCGCWSEHARHAPPREAERALLDTGYDARPEDPRIVRRYGAKEAIATSSGQNDTGLFELNFRDERYLPFEFEGAVSRWRIELPPENNYFDMDTLSDVVLHLNYTAREGGDTLRNAARKAAEGHVPDAGRRVFDVRQELADAWRRFQAQRTEDGKHRQLELCLGRDMFMFLPGHRDVSITRIEVLFEAPDAEPGEHREVELVIGHRRGCKHSGRDDVREFQCVASAEWPGRYRGVLNLHIGPLSWREHDLVGALRFHPSHGPLRELYVVCSYETSEQPMARTVSTARRFPDGQGH